MDRHRGRRAILGLTIALVALSWTPGPVRAAASGVDEVGTSFQPAEVRIAVNDKVVWTNRSSQSHTVTFTGGPDLHPSCDPLLRLGCQAPGATVERTFTAPGTYGYYCKIHSPSMRGSVVVGATSTTLATTSSTLPKSSSTTATTQKPTSSTTTPTRPLSTSSTSMKPPSSSSSTSETSSVVLPGDAPPLSGDEGSNAASRSDDSNGSDSGTVALIVALLLGVSGGGGYLLWRLRPGRP
jgi:plastocyanin